MITVMSFCNWNTDVGFEIIFVCMLHVPFVNIEYYGIYDILAL